MARMQQESLSLRDKIRARIDSLAQSSGQSKTEVVRNAIAVCNPKSQ